MLDIARSYVAAGSDMIGTNSFGGHPLKLTHHGLSDKAFEINLQAASLSRKAAGSNVYVLGSIGPTGKLLMMGDVTPEEMYEGFRLQAKALSEGGADALCVETMSDPGEALLAVKAAGENTELPVFCTFTFERNLDGIFRTMMGTTVEEAVRTLLTEKPEVIGSNCGNGMELMIPIIQEMHALAPGIPLMVQANAGKPVLRDGKTIFPESPGEMAAHLPALAEAGARIIGGCCGTTPGHIRRFREEINKLTGA